MDSQPDVSEEVIPIGSLLNVATAEDDPKPPVMSVSYRASRLAPHSLPPMRLVPRWADCSAPVPAYVFDQRPGLSPPGRRGTVEMPILKCLSFGYKLEGLSPSRRRCQKCVIARMLLAVRS
jgi:hypothetical protein